MSRRWNDAKQIVLLFRSGVRTSINHDHSWRGLSFAAQKLQTLHPQQCQGTYTRVSRDRDWENRVRREVYNMSYFNDVTNSSLRITIRAHVCVCVREKRLRLYVERLDLTRGGFLNSEFGTMYINGWQNRQKWRVTADFTQYMNA